MNRETKTNIIYTALLFAVFAVFTILVKTVDVQAIGPEGSKVGFASLNGFIRDALGVHEFWYKLTKLFGIVAILVAAFFGFIGLMQLIQGKSLKNVEMDIWALGITYVVTIAFYALFEKLIINYRPIIKDAEEGLEASYPSSHTMLIIVVLGTAIIEIGNRIRDEKIARIIRTVLGIIIAVTVIGRLICGVHWFTDIIAGMILGATLISLYITLKGALTKSKK